MWSRSHAVGVVARVRGRPGLLRGQERLLADGEQRADVGHRGIQHAREGTPAAWRGRRARFGHTSSKQPITTCSTKCQSFSLPLDGGEEEHPVAALSETMGLTG
jgi:hypothetical protein